MKDKERTATSLWIVLSRAYQTMKKQALENIHSLGFKCETDFAVLEILLHKGALPVNTIGQKILLTSGSITTAIQRLETEGWVEKKVDNVDKRKILVELTDKGYEKIKPAFELHRDRLEVIMKHVDSSEKEILAELLKKLAKKN